MTAPAPVLWLDASDAGTLTFGVGAKLSGWADKSASSNDASQANAALQGSIVTSQFAAGALELNADEGMTLASPVALSGATVFMVLYVINTGGAVYASMVLNDGDISLGNDEVGFIGEASSRTGLLQVDTNDAGAAYVWSDPTKSDIKTGKYVAEFLIGADVDSTALQLSGVDITGTNSGPASWTITVSQLGLQSFYGSNSNQVAEIRVYDSALTDDDRGDVRTELTDKWDVPPPGAAANSFPIFFGAGA